MCRCRLFPTNHSDMPSLKATFDSSHIYYDWLTTKAKRTIIGRHSCVCELSTRSSKQIYAHDYSDLYFFCIEGTSNICQCLPLAVCDFFHYKYLFSTYFPSNDETSSQNFLVLFLKVVEKKTDWHQTIRLLCFNFLFRLWIWIVFYSLSKTVCFSKRIVSRGNQPPVELTANVYLTASTLLLTFWQFVLAVFSLRWRAPSIKSGCLFKYHIIHITIRL